ncbi:hypothetical protein F8388_000876 [Cannabis sativa]|uniref:Uncharacterized protein n=1 Tax=Cannabis sativa TaxID=3483 RepID=A0A7J6FSE3_CANSA|nr:hypothetical protein F8388_000876 [Cannabis sativa]
MKSSMQPLISIGCKLSWFGGFFYPSCLTLSSKEKLETLESTSPKPYHTFRLLVNSIEHNCHNALVQARLLVLQQSWQGLHHHGADMLPIRLSTRQGWPRLALLVPFRMPP